MHIATDIVFADHYQFYIYDVDFDHYNDSRLDWTKGEKLTYGYMATERAIYVSTVADLNNHRLRVYFDEIPSSEYERVFTTELQIKGNAIKISAPANVEDDNLLISLSPGRYLVTVCSRNIGIDELTVLPDRDEPLSDEEFICREDIESYDLFIQPSPNTAPNSDARYRSSRLA